MSKRVVPWKAFDHSKRPTTRTLQMWRVRARKNAQALGAHTSCDLCKRPIQCDGRYGRVGLRPANAWRSRLLSRHICNSCYLVLKTVIEDLEINGARDHLPPEDYVAPGYVEEVEAELPPGSAPVDGEATIDV